MSLTKIVVFFLVFDFAFLIVMGAMMPQMIATWGGDEEEEVTDIAYEVQQSSIERIQQPFSLNPIEAVIQIYVKANAIFAFLGSILINPFLALSMMPTEMFLFFTFLYFLQIFVFIAWFIGLIWSGKD